jgi:predicted PurR-regulated permease PerM
MATFGGDSSTPPNGLTEAAAWRVASRLVLLVFALLLLVWLAVQLRDILVQLLLAVILAAGMTPLVNALTEGEQIQRWRWRPPRALVVLLLYVLLLVLITLVGAVVLPPLVNEVEDLASRLPFYLQSIQDWIEALPLRYSFLPAIDLSQGLAAQLRLAASQLTGLFGQALIVIRLAIGLLSGALNGIFTLILALYLTADSKRILRYGAAFLPNDRQPQAERIAHHIGQRLGGWVRGQLLLSAIIGTMTLVGLSVLGVRYAVLLAIIAAIGEVIPMIGPIVSAVPAVIIAFIYSPVQGLLTLVLYVVIQQLENNLVVPKVMERAVSLHPLAVMLALLAGSQLLGIAGAVLSVPVTAALSVIVDEVRRERIGDRLGETGSTDLPLSAA